jgi:YbbR domain-containing protein
MALRDLISHNLGLKLISLLLAILLWFTIRFGLDRGAHQRELGPLPVIVMRDPLDSHGYSLKPPTVMVSVSGPRRVIEGLTGKEIQVFINLTGVQPNPPFTKRVEVFTPNPITMLRVEPAAVRVEGIPLATNAPTISP